MGEILPGAAFSIVDMDDAVSVHLQAPDLRVRPKIRHHATPAGVNPEIDRPTGEVKGVRSAAGTPVARAVAVGGFDADGTEFFRNGGDDFAQIARNAIGRGTRPQRDRAL